MRRIDIKKSNPRQGSLNNNNDTGQLNFLFQLVKKHIPMTEPPARGGSDEMKCQVASTGSILDFVGDRVHG